MWPAGSSGCRQNGHGGRPAATSAWARATKSRAYDAVILTTKTSSALISSDSTSPAACSLGLLLLVGVDVGEQLDHDPVDARIPGDGHRADPELLGDRRVQRVGVAGGGRGRRHVHLTGAAAQHLVEHPVQVLGQHRDLLLLARDAGDPVALTGLQEERALARLTDGTGDEAVRRVVAVYENGHGPSVTGAARAVQVPRRLRSTASGAPRPPPTWASVRRRSGGPRVLGGRDGTGRPDRPSVELTVITYGRAGGVADHRDRSRIDHDPLEAVEVHAQRVGQDRLDQVAVRDRRPDRVRPMLSREPGVPGPDGTPPRASPSPSSTRRRETAQPTAGAAPRPRASPC